jgi:ABC-2 type transport system ATP-binding protein
MDDDNAISVEHVYKDFRLPHDKSSTLKSQLINGLRGGKGYDIQHALKDVSFEVKKGEFFGIVGRNGSGKSTLLKIIAGIYQPNKGSVKVKGRLVAFIELGVGFNGELTGRENVYLNGALLGFSKKEVRSMYKDIVEFAELEPFMDQKLKNYSSGMQVRLAFSLAIRAEADILLVDEVLAVGDADFQRKCFNYFKNLKKQKKTVVFVSHDMGAVREFCDRALLIEQSEVQESGTPTKIANLYSRLFIREEMAESQNQEEEFRDGRRWGNGHIKITNVKVSQVKDELVFKVQAAVRQPLNGVMYGIHIVSSDGNDVTAMNNRMIEQPDLRNLKKGDDVEFTWKMLNVFNDGKYYLTLTLVDEAGIAFDWFTEAASFKIERTERSTTAVLPPISVEHRINSK